LVDGGDVQEGRVQRHIGAGHFGHPREVFGMVGMVRAGQGVHDLLVAGKTSGVFQSAMSGAVDQSGRWTCFVHLPA
jgi:hypothetical protein